MGHKTLIDGTEYAILGGATNVSGTGYNINGGATKVDGTKYAIQFGSVVDKPFAECTWEEIIHVCQTRNRPSTWNIGDVAPMTVNGASYKIMIIGEDCDEYADGSGTALFTFQFKEVYASKLRFCASTTDASHWETSVIRNTSLPSLLSTMPTVVQANIRFVNKHTKSSAKDSTLITTSDKLFLLSEFEIRGTTAYSLVEDGPLYGYTAMNAASTAAKRYKRGSSTAESHGLRIKGGSDTKWLFVQSNGTVAAGANTTLYAAPAFCF